MDRKLQRGVFVVFVANLINIAFHLGTSLILPKYLSIDSYAHIKTYQLYISYIGIFHFGFVDGMYLRYGGMELGRRIEPNLTSDKSTMCIFQIVVSIILLVIALIVQDKIIIAFAASVFPVNLINYYKLLYQATGEFKLYGRIMNATTILTFVVNSILLFIFRLDIYIYYLVAYILLYCAVLIWFEIDFRRKHTCIRGAIFDRHILTSNVKNGFLLTLGALSSVLLTGMDRWFVKALMPTFYFAQYSFAVTVETFLNSAISPITTTLYNFFCREEDERKHRAIFKYSLVFATLLPACCFLVKFILEIYLKNYLESSHVIFLLFAAQMFYIIINSVFINLYKSQKRQKEYFGRLLTVIIIGFLLNTILYNLLGNMEAFAVGTLLSAIIWFFICRSDFCYIQIGRKECLYLILSAMMFLVIGTFFSSLLGLLLYLIGVVLLLQVFQKETLIRIIWYLRTYAMDLRNR